MKREERAEAAAGEEQRNLDVPPDSVGVRPDLEGRGAYGNVEIQTNVRLRCATYRCGCPEERHELRDANV